MTQSIQSGIVSKDFLIDSPFLKVFSSIPILGVFPRVITASAMHQKLDRALNGPEKDNPRLIKLIEIKNEYLIADVVRDVLTVALLIAALSFGIFGVIGLVESFLIGSFLGFSAMAAAINFSHVLYNREVIEEIRETGVRSGMVIQ